MAFPEPLSRVGNQLMLAAALGCVSALTGCRDPFRIPTLVVGHAEFGFSGDARSGCCHPHIFVLNRDPRTDLTVPLFSNTKAGWRILHEFCRDFENTHGLTNAIVEGRLHKKFKPDYPQGLSSGQRADLCGVGRECCLDVATGRAKTRSDFERNFENKHLRIESISDDGFTIGTPAGQTIRLSGGIMSKQEEWGELKKVYEELFGRNEKAIDARNRKRGACDSVFEKRRREWDEKYEKSSKGGPLGEDYIEALGGGDSVVSFGNVGRANSEPVFQPRSGTQPRVAGTSDGDSQVEWGTGGNGSASPPVEVGRGVSSGGGSVDSVSRNRPHSSRIPDEERDTVGGQTFRKRTSGLKNGNEINLSDLDRESLLPAEKRELNWILQKPSMFGLTGDESGADLEKRNEKADADERVSPDTQGAVFEDEFDLLARANLPENLYDILKPNEELQANHGRSAPERGIQR